MKHRESDIAVIGMSCRFPGAADPEQYWANLAAGRVSIGEVPETRWRWQDYRDESQPPEATPYCRWAGLIDDVDAFDAAFFNVSPREAESMDPQQRLGLELAWSCFEDAGMRPSHLSSQKVGVFLGFTNLDYKEIMEESPIDIYYATGTLSSVIPNRISYHFNLRGPSVAVDTACSSSLHAIHLACRALIEEECDTALAGGISLLLTPKRFLWYGKAGILSPTGAIRSFDEDADGTVRGEGAGFILLKPLERAIADGNRIVGVIKGSAVNHGGKHHTLTYPSAVAQAEVIASALRAARVAPGEVSYVECHGTGTRKGDPIEVQGLLQVLDRSDEGASCGLGCVKPNIGHLEGAAGIAGVIKVLQAFRHKTLPPSVNLTRVNSRIDLGGAVYFVDRLQAWEPRVRGGIQPPRIAGVSSFGFAGTNAHVVLAEAPTRGEEDGVAAVSPADQRVIVVLSAKDQACLKDRADQLQQTIARRGLTDRHLRATAYTLQVGREPMEERLGFLVSSMGELSEKLQVFLADGTTAGVLRGRAQKSGELVTLLAQDEVFRVAVETWVEQGRLEMLLELWIKGLDIDWSKLYGDAKRRFVDLPTYPFARTRYWAELATSRDVGSNGAGAAVFHPLLQDNTSDLSGQRYGTTFTGAEFFLADHQVRNGEGTSQKVLPGVTYLEMARAAVEKASVPWPEPSVLELLDTVWLRPIVVDAETRVNIGLLPVDGDQIEYEIYSENGDEEVVACQGRAVFRPSSGPSTLDIGQLEARMVRDTLDEDSVYATFARMGMAYGPAFRAITAVYRGDGELLAHVRLPDSVGSTARAFTLHPSLMDGALQAAIVLDGGAEARAPRLPFALDRLRIISPCSRDMIAWARYSPESETAGRVVKMDIDLCDHRGTVCVQLRGFAARVPAHQIRGTRGDLFATPVWQASASMPDRRGSDHAEHHVMLCELPGADVGELNLQVPNAQCFSLRADRQKDIAERYEEHARECFERIQEILRRKPAGTVLFQIVIADHEEQTIFAGLSALLETARLENPRFIGQVLLVPVDVNAVELGRHLQDEKSAGPDTVIRHGHSAREVSRWEEIALDRENVPSAFEASGVYLVTGGLGGLGRLFATEILERSPGARVVLTGRGELTSERRAWFDESSASGKRLTYRRVDLSDCAQVEQLIDAIIREHGKLNGILHCAGMIADQFIVNKGGAEFRQVLAPKVTGTYHLDLATRDVELDFFVLFSSIAGALGNFGQSDYASANGFQDRFAAYRNRQVATGRRHGRTRSINWPLWQAGGMAIDAEGRELLERTTGIQPMATATGIDAFHRSLALPYDRILVAEGELTRIRRTLFGAPAAPPGPSAEAQPPAAEIESTLLAEKTQNYLLEELSAVLKLPAHRIDPQVGLDTYGIDSVLAMKLTNQLERTFGSLSRTLFFEYQTVGALTRYFLGAHADRLASLFAGMSDASRRRKPAAALTPLTLEEQPRRKRHAVRRDGPSALKSESDTIAIIGLSGRYPEAIDVAAYWRNLRDGKNCIVEVPKERWDWREYFTEDRGESGRHYSKWGGFIEGVDEFDPLFFKIAPKEAKYLDPQERLFLQHAWMAVEDAGYTRASLERPADDDLPGQVGVYVGVMYTEYQLFGAEVSARGRRMGMAGSAASIANRVSYALNLHGPSVTLDTMCSSSLTAIHFACEDLRRGRTAMAIAGGVNVSIHPNKYLLLSAGQFISSEGHCQSFGEGGDGYIPGEGVGVVVLKRLSEAKIDRDHIYGVIRGSAINHGGKTNGYTVPNPQAQASAIIRALADAHVDARHVSYIEAHGTGTKLGDPIEIAALSKAFAHHTNDTQFCLLGSAKSNIGHCESAAGVAGLTKVLLQMQHQQIVPSLHSARLNPHVDFSSGPFVVNQTLRSWEQPEVAGSRLPRIAGISSFGAGGSNAHLIVEEYQAPPPQPVAPADVAIVLSARTAAQLQQKVRDLLDFLRPPLNTIDLHALGYTLQAGRETMDERLGFVASSMEHVVETLQALAAGEQSIKGVHRGQVKREERAVSLLSTDSDLRETIDKWMAGRKLSKLLALWVEGVELDWHKLHGEAKPQRISLPVYPFARERYWIDIAAATDAAPAKAVPTAVLHPLLHTNTSDFGQQRYSSTFSGEEFFLKDQRLFPAAAYLEMARAAIRNAAGIAGDEYLELRDVVWGQPAIVTQEIRIDIALAANDENEIDYEIFGQDGVVHCRGRAILSAGSTPRTLDLRQLKADHERLVDLQLPTAEQDASAGHVLFLRDALHAGFALIGSGVPRLPLALDSLRVISPCSRDVVAWVRYSPGSRAADGIVKLDIDLCDARGSIAIEMRGAAWDRTAVESVSHRQSGGAAEGKKPTGISLSAPGAHVSAASPSPNRAPVTLTNPVSAPASVSPICLLDEGNGIFSIQIRDGDNVAGLLCALDLVRREKALKVLKVVGLDRCLRSSGREDYNEALEQGLYQAIASFPYPVIAVLPSDTAGAAFLCAALCDFLVCDEDAIYRYTDAERQFYPTPAEALLFAERFGEARALDFLYLATSATGKQLRERGWTCSIAASTHIEAVTRRLATALATKSRESLRLLKQHLSRHLGGFVDALGRVDAPVSEAAGTLATTGIDSPGAPIQVNTFGENVLVVTFDPVGPEELVAALSEVVAKAHRSGACKAIVLASTAPEFLPDVIDEDAVLELHRLIAGSEIPVVAALTGNARGNAWLIGQLCDAAVYCTKGVYSAAAVVETAATIFARRLGTAAAAEVLFTGAEYSGIDLAERTGTLMVAEHDQVVPTAVRVAESWAKLPTATLASWKKQTAALLPTLQAAPGPQADQRSVAMPAIPTPIALRSKVVKATAHPEGIVVVRLEDRDVKNMFSEAFMAGVSEVFAHIEQTQAYKVVILTGYDQYFACGATQELLLAIHEARIKFTDYNIYQLPLTCKVPVISAIQGHAIGAGWTLGMFADIALLSEESRYVNPYMDYGFTPGDGATWVFSERVGHDLANESHLTALHYTGGELRRRGLRLPVLPRVEVFPAAMALARRIAQTPRSRLTAIKAELTRQAPEELQETYRLEVALHDEILVGRPDTLARILGNFHGSRASVADGAQQASRQVVATTGTASAAVTARLKSLLAHELQMREKDADENLPFVDLGLDSVAGVSWVRKINEMYQTSIEAASIYRYPTLAAFSGHVQEEAERRGTLDRPALATTTGSDMLRAVMASLKTLLADELQMQESDVDENRQFVDLGLDSVAGVSWIRKINEKYQTSFDAASIYSYPTLASLSRYVTTEAEKRDLLPRAVQAHNTVAATPAPQMRLARRSGPSSRNTSGASNRQSPTPIAIIGMAGEFPEASNLGEFWRNIAQGRNCISQVPPQRWDVNAYYRSGDVVDGKTNCRWLGALANYDRFDPLFFNISPTEAESMDPQQRLFLQACWHAIEDAAYDARSLSGTRCGVFAGCAYGDYHLLSREQQLSAQGWTGDVTSILAARISYHLNLQGPCLSIDTACSSSLVAVAQACDSLIAGGSDLALAGGVYVMAGPEALIRASQSGMLSTEGRCFTFDTRANGFVPGEGVGVVLLKRLADAERDHDIIRAVIHGWGVNQDGKTNGITAPNPESQIRLEQEVYDRYGIDPGSIQLVEAHGTGTKLGDPIEVLALKQAFRKYTRERDFCALGSVKSNIGHLSMAAGIAGFIKAVLALQHKQLPPTINFEQLNEHIDLSDSPFYVNTRLQPWEPKSTLPRQAAVSSFGFSGTNAHVVVGEYLTPVGNSSSLAGVIQDGRSIVPLSAKRPEQLEQRARDLLAYLRNETDSGELLDIAYSLQVGREPMDVRVAFLVSTVAQLVEALEAYVDDEAGIQNVYEGQVKRADESIDLLSHDAETREAVVAQWIAQKKLDKLAEWWVRGVELQWNSLYGEVKPRRLPLPGYPFAKERHWIDVQPGRYAAVSTAASAVLHPLLHDNVSDPGERRYTSTFSGDEFFLADHRIKGEAILPGVAYLEMVRAAVGHAFPAWRDTGVLELDNTVWMQPLVVTGSTQINLALRTDEDDIDFEIYSRGGEDEIVHCQGRAVLSGDPVRPQLDLDEIALAMNRGGSAPDGLYAAFSRLGGVYGTAFQAITRIYEGPGQLLARLRLPDTVDSTLADYVLHPSLMDAALQGYPVLMEGWPDSNQPRMPFAVESVRVLAPCTREMAAWVRYAPDSEPTNAVVKLDIDLCEPDGTVCVQMRGFSTRALRSERTTAQAIATGTLLMTPMWHAAESAGVGGGDFVQHHVMVSEPAPLDVGVLASLIPGSRCRPLRSPRQQTIAQRYSDYAVACFGRLQRILRGKPQGKVLLQVVVFESDPEQTLLAGLSGILKTAALENPQVVGQLLVVTPEVSAEKLAAHLRDERHGTLSPVVRYERGMRSVLQWEEVAAGPDVPPLAFVDGGVYLITGGLGRLGALFAEEIIARCAMTRVILTGRSPLSTERQAQFDAVNRHDGRVVYRPVDLGDLEQVIQLIAFVTRDYGSLNGILHAAGMIADNFIIKKAPAEFRETLAPKVIGTFNLDQACRDAELDFFALFSSIAGAMGNVGQVDYAAANGFLDQFAAYRNRLVAAGQRCGRTRSINWPLWEAGGMAADRDSIARLRELTGMQPMRTTTGIQAFYRSLAVPYDQVLAAEGDLSQMRRALLTGSAAAAAPAKTRPASAPALDPRTMAERAQDYLCRELAGVLKLTSSTVDPRAPLATYGIDSILAMRLTSRLEATFGSLPKTLFFEYQTIRDLTEYFITERSTQLAQLFATSLSSRSEAESEPAAVPRSEVVSRRRPARGGRAAPAAGKADAIAIIGLSGRYPEAWDIEAFWRNLQEGRDCIGEVPPERWDWREYYSADRSETGRHYSKWGGFIDGVAEFDPVFFNISPKEAKYIDPQERLFLQHAWMAIEDAGYTRASLQIPQGDGLPGQVGVYAGVWSSEYQLFGAEASMLGERMGFAISVASIANRVSYALNLHGPSMALDTMCSASLTSIHIACQDLRLGRIGLAIAGGVNINIHPNKYLMLSAAQAISTDGRCRSFGEAGDGYIPAEGVGVVILKRLSEAERDGDHIYGVIRGSAVSHGGRTNGYTVPNPHAQTDAIRRALADAHVDPRHISYVETHGTGTRLGDPVEIAALRSAFRASEHENDVCCPIGSVKSNIGHCESAAGIAGLTKVLLQMRHRRLVPSLHSAKLNANIDFHDGRFVVNQSSRPWERPVIDGRSVSRIAGISSFGASGANAHLIVEEYHQPLQRPAASGPVVILLSARTTEQLQQKARELLAFVRAQTDVDLAAMAYTLQVGREAMEERLGFVVSSLEQLTDRLHACVAGEQDIEDVHRGQVKRNKEALLLFSTDADLQQTVDKWIANRKLSRVLELWVKGLDVDWSKLYGEARPARVSLPTYPFARERHWVDAPAGGRGSADGAAAAVLHPLLHSNISVLSEQRYGSVFTGEEFFLADHQVQGRSLFPGMACLELARAAIAHSSPPPPEAVLEILDTVWTQPIAMTSRKEISIALAANDDDAIDFEIYTKDGEQTIVHCQGRAVWSRREAPASLDLERLEAQMARGRREPDSLYASCARIGLVYGPSLQSVTDIHEGSDELVARLRLPRSVEGKSRDYVLHPSLMDGALQACVGLVEDWSSNSTQPWFPSVLESLEIIAPCTSEMAVWVRYAPDRQAADPVVKVDVDLSDEQGRVCVRMKGFAIRQLEGEVGESRTLKALPDRDPNPPMGLLTLAPRWEPVEVEAGEVRPRAGEWVVVIGGEDEDHRALRKECGGAEVLQVGGRAAVEEIAEKLRGGRPIDHVVWILPRGKQRERPAFIEDQEEGVLLGFRLMQALLREGYGEGELAWTVITNATQRIAGEHEQTLDPAHSSVHGLVGSMAKEYAKWKVRLVDVGPGALPWGSMLRLGWGERDRGWGYREGQWYRRRLVECDFGEMEKSGYKREGVYVVIGGAGGLGEVLSEYLITNYDANVVWLGRRDKDEAIEKKQARLAAGGGGEGPFYIVADARKREDLESASKQIKERYGRIDGVIHSSIVLAGERLADMTEDQFRAGLSAKVDVAVRLEQVFGREPLDFILYFSSVQAFLKAPGWSNYAAGCTFTDAFAQWQSGKVSYPVKVMNWGYWGSVGAVATAEYRERIELGGMGSIEPQQGMAGLERLLSGPLAQMGMIRVKRVELARALGVDAGAGAQTTPPRFVPVPAVAAIESSAFEETGHLGLPERVEAWLVEAVGLLLKMKREDIDVDSELSVFGFDSISLTDFTQHVNRAFVLELMPTIFYEHATLRSFARHLVKDHEERLVEKLIPERQAVTTTPRPRLTGDVARRRGRGARAATEGGRTAEQPKVEGSRPEAIAVIGMSGRFPDAEDLDAFWENLKAGRDSIQEIPRERWDWRTLYGDAREDINKKSVRWGAFIEGVDEFDPLFFGISPSEAEWMDPQQRLLMTYGWKAFEDAGYGPRQLWGSRTGIFIGTGNTGFGELLAQARGGIEGYSVAGGVPSVGPSRLSYFLNLHGPSEPVETACSSSLVAIHRAVRAILGDECEMALVGGVNTLLTPTPYISLSKAGMLSPEGKCKTFSNAADGYVRGEGVGMIVLKKVSAAERDGDHIYGLIRGSAENHGGRAQSLTAPNPHLQAELIKDAYRRAGVSPRTVSYIETHGTGTALGDPIEINGLKSAFESLSDEMGEQTDGACCGLGAVKSNIGHLEMAAGIAGVIKVLLQLQHGTLVPSLHCEELNPYILLDESPFYIVKTMQPWNGPKDAEPLRAGVSSFGFGGVNAHVLVEEYVGRAGTESEAHGPVMVLLSARNGERLKERARQLKQAIGRRRLRDKDLVRLAYTLQVGRDAMEHRLGMTVGSMQELEGKLEQFVEGKAGIEGLYRGEVRRNSETLAASASDEELREAVGKWMQRGKWSRLLELWVQGFPVQWEQLYGKARPRRLSLPTYPFAKERYWIDTKSGGDGAATGTATSATIAATAVVHPLLHRNTSDLSGQRYTSLFTGNEFFLTDHRVRMNGSGPQKILPASAYLEMARAALEQASPGQQTPALVELRYTTWLRPVVVTEHAEISITLIPVSDHVDYEIYSVNDGRETTHCRGQAVLDHPATLGELDLGRLRSEMTQGRLEAAGVYALFETMGLRYGPSHQGIVSIGLGQKQVLARLCLPAAIDASRHDYVLHPGLLDSAQQASIGLLVGENRIPDRPRVPFLLDSLRVGSPCTAEMFAWVRYSVGTSAASTVDIDVCDQDGKVCVQMRGFATRDMGGQPTSPVQQAVLTSASARLPIKRQNSSFDRAFYQKLIADIANREITVDEAVKLK